jgi:hypothetical protein
MIYFWVTNDIEFKPFGEQAGSPCVGLSAPLFKIKFLEILYT